MRKGPLPLFILGAALLGITAGALYYQAQRDPVLDSLNEAEETALPAEETLAREGSDATLPATDPQQIPESTAQPDLATDESGFSKSTLTLATTRGLIRFKLFPEQAPRSTARIVELVQQKFYHGLTFHKVLPNFVVQTGSPDGSLTGGSGKKLKAEFNPRKHIEGSIGLARGKDPDSADSQFYITLSPQPHLDGSYTVIGQVIEGMDVVRSIRQGDKILYLVIQ